MITIPRHNRFFQLTIILLLLFASRMPRLLSFPMDVDEVWTAWQSIGTLDRVLAWVPYDWSPLHYITVWAWQSLTGAHPLTLRLLSTFMLMIGAACLYRAARHLMRSDEAALVAMAIYGALTYTVFLSVLLRGYAMLYMLTPILLLLTLRYFDRPTWQRALPLAVCLAIMFYTHLSIVALFPFIGVLTLMLYGRRIWRWWLPIAVALLLVLPLVIQQLPLLVSRASAVEQATTLPFFTALGNWYVDFAGDAALLWLVLLVIAAISVVIHRPQAGLALLLWGLAPAIVLLLNNQLGFFTLRHLAWVGVGLALLAAQAVKVLPRFATSAVLLTALVLMWLPFAPDRYIWDNTKPNIEVFSWLQDHWRDGDVVYIDPTTDPIPPEAWDYFARAYFPNGLPIVRSPDGYRRVWYAAISGWNRPDDQAAVERGRLASEFVGPWNFLVRLYEAPPDPTGVVFEKGPRFHGFDVIGANTPGYLVSHEDDELQLRLWWSVDQPLPADYSIVVQLLDQNGALIAQTPDRSGSDDVPKETRQWQPDQFYVEELALPVPPKAWLGAPSTVEYQVVLTVYQWWDGVRLSAPGVTAAMVLPLAPLRITAW